MCMYACVLRLLMWLIYVCVVVEVFLCGSLCSIGLWGRWVIVQLCCGMVCMSSVIVCGCEVWYLWYTCVVYSDGDVGLVG